MTAPTFTPGPWRRVGHRTIAAGSGADRKTICELYSWGDCSEADGNEALIATAPELHAARPVPASEQTDLYAVGVTLYQLPQQVAVRNGLANYGAPAFSTTDWEDVGWST